jgi:hypothetical protein
MNSRPQLVAYLEGILKRVADSKAPSNADDATMDDPETSLLIATVEQLRRENDTLRQGCRAAFARAAALNLSLATYAAPVGAPPSASDAVEAFKGVEVTGPRLVVMAHEFSEAQMAYRTSKRVTDDDVFFWGVPYGTSPKRFHHFVKAEIRLLDATPDQVATLSYALCYGDGSTAVTGVLEVLDSSSLEATATRDAVVCYRVLTEGLAGGEARPQLSVKLWADGVRETRRGSPSTTTTSTTRRSNIGRLSSPGGRDRRASFWDLVLANQPLRIMGRDSISSCASSCNAAMRN